MSLCQLYWTVGNIAEVAVIVVKLFHSSLRPGGPGGRDRQEGHLGRFFPHRGWLAERSCSVLSFSSKLIHSTGPATAFQVQKLKFYNFLLARRSRRFLCSLIRIYQYPHNQSVVGIAVKGREINEFL